jgi:PAS domain S-box-containing protein
VNPPLPVQDYQALLQRWLDAQDALQREAVLLDATELAKSLLPQRLSVDDLLALHQRAQAHCAAQADLPEAHRQRLARGEALPLMLTTLLPQQLDEQSRAERRWREEHDKLSAIFQQTDDLVLIFHADGTLDYLNPAFQRATGWWLEAARSQSHVVWPHPLPRHGAKHLSAAQACSNGSHFMAAWSVSSITDQDARLLSHVCIGRDITQAQRLEETARQNDKLRAVATLAAGVAHDFNNLLGAIIGLAEVSALFAGPDPAQGQRLDGILLASRRAADLVGQLLSFAREQPLKLQRLSLAGLVQRCQALLAASLPAGVTLTLSLDDPGPVLADAAQMEQVLLNLVKNAGDAMRGGVGEVQLLLDRLAPEPGAAAMARLRVVDTGPGMAADVLPRIFEPFFTTKPVNQGTGLGLSAAFGIVRHHGGRLDASSPPGEGACFSVWLPLCGDGA